MSIENILLARPPRRRRSRRLSVLLAAKRIPGYVPGPRRERRDPAPVLGSRHDKREGRVITRLLESEDRDLEFVEAVGRNEWPSPGVERRPFGGWGRC